MSSLPCPRGRGQTGTDGGVQFVRAPLRGSLRRAVTGLTGIALILNIPRLMSADAPKVPVPEVLDASRMVAARRGVAGRVPLSALTRLRDSLVDTDQLTVTINTDNRLFSRTSMTEEFWRAHTRCGLTEAELRQIALNGFRYAFLHYDEKQALLEEVAGNFGSGISDFGSVNGG